MEIYSKTIDLKSKDENTTILEVAKIGSEVDIGFKKLSSIYEPENDLLFNIKKADGEESVDENP